MADNARGIHVSPGVYTREYELLPAVKSLGITSLGLVGETEKGPAFQPMDITNWREYVDLFGSTNPEKYKGSKYPKYELPYIAQSYLSQSKRLSVCRVLGLSGYNAGPAWAITGKVQLADGSTKEMVIAIIRSRGHYEKYYKFNNETGTCECQYQSYDTLLYDVGEKVVTECNKAKEYNMNALQIGQYIPLDSTGNECIDYTNSKLPSSFEATTTNYGRLKLFGWIGTHTEEELEGYVTYSEGDGATPTEDGYNSADYFEYPVSLNPSDNDYILKVLGTRAEVGDAPIYVESLYDVAWKQQIESLNVGNTIAITDKLTTYQVYYPSDYCGFQPFDDFMYLQEEQLTRKDIGKRFIATAYNVNNNFHCHAFDYKSGKPIFKGKTVMYKYDESGKASTIPDESHPGEVKKYSIGIEYKVPEGQSECVGCSQEMVEVPQIVELGQIYTVSQYTDESGKRHYYYRHYPYNYSQQDADLATEDGYIKYMRDFKNIDIIPIIDKLFDQTSGVEISNVSGIGEGIKRAFIAKCKADSLYYRIAEIDEIKDVYPVRTDMNNYKSAYRYSSTPWIISDIKGDFKHIELNRLFRFHTISDGNSSCQQIKVSITNIDYDNGVFDVLVRDIYDTDESQIVYEKYSKVGLIPGLSNYIGLVIGTFDGAYESKSKYITVEINEADTTKNSVPCGFLGYPIHDYSGLEIAENGKKDVIAPILKYNLNYDEDIKQRKQYFGLSDIVGVDVDAFTFKGNMSYYDSPTYYCQGFHLDSRLDETGYTKDEMPEITVDGEYGYKFDAVSVNNRTTVLTGMPIIGKEIDMEGSIYEDKQLRKFTVYFYGGFDGWDVYRDERSNTDDFKKSKYRGDYNDLSGEGYSFDKIDNPSLLDINESAITSDYYAYLSAIRKYHNPESVDINVFATPGIDYVNQKSLVSEAIEMIEEERADSLYVITTPDKPSGADDYIENMYTAEDVVYNLEDSEITSNYACTYYPWVKYFDTNNNQYIMLPATKDVVRNLALTDNTTYAWFAPAGYTRGTVDCTRAHFITKIDDEDTLYEGRINPIKTFAQDGVKVWGQKTLQLADGQLNRINVRRLLLRIRKMIAIACTKLIFEPNDATTKNKFLSLVTPILDNVKSNRGITDYRIEVYDSAEARMRLELPAKIFIKPVQALEYITLDFIITAENVSFDDI